MDEAFKGPDGVVCINGVVSDVKHGLGSNLRAKEHIVFVLKVVVNVVCVVRIHNLIDGVKSEVETVVVADEKSIDFGRSSARSRRFCSIIARIDFKAKLLRLIRGVFSINFIAGVDWRAQPV